jgi:hypothetical protein
VEVEQAAQVTMQRSMLRRAIVRMRRVQNRGEARSRSTIG